jgi:hypothetical protein
VRHTGKDCEHGLILNASTSHEAFAAPPNPAEIGDWCVVGANAINTQIVRFGTGADCYGLEIESMQDSVRPALVELARLVAARTPPPSQPSGLAQFCTHVDAAEVFAAPAYVSGLFGDETVTWACAASVQPTTMETLLLQRPVSGYHWGEEPPGIDRPFVRSNANRMHAPDGATTTFDSSVEVWWDHGGTMYRLSHSRSSFDPGGTAAAPPQFLAAPPAIALARRIASRLDDRDR